ncbi:MAG: IS66 family insertion sequence element accessory protein TnpB [Saccharofermentanales bacterium]
MLELNNNENIYLALGKTDMRKSIDGLSAIVTQKFKLDPFADAMFVFCGNDRCRIKILKWDNNGFWLYYKVLQSGKFNLPKDQTEIKQLNMREFRWFLDGLDIDQPRAHKDVKASILC